MAEINYITPQGVENLRNELQDLMRNERPKVVATVAWAASNGDRSENADYIYGKRRLREIDRRIAILTFKIENAQVVDPSTIKSDSIVFGSTVTVEDEEGEEKTYQIVGEDEININEGKISWKSPVAKALLGKKIDDEVLLVKPKSQSVLLITKIQFI